MTSRRSLLAFALGALALLTAATAIADVRHDAQTAEVRGDAAVAPEPATPTVARFEFVAAQPVDVAVATPVEPAVLRDRVAVRRAHPRASRARS